MSEVTRSCSRCGGARFVVVERNGRSMAVRCQCLDEWRKEAVFAATCIPERYQHCTVESFELWKPQSQDPTLGKAKERTEAFVRSYPDVDRGILFLGKVGTGKTHLAVAALRAVVESRKGTGLYVNVTELIQRLQMSIDGRGPTREALLGPVVDTELLVLDELGACRSTEWVLDQLYFVINQRYSHRRVTLATSNFLDTPAGRCDPAAVVRAFSQATAAGTVMAPVKSEQYFESLADRISDRLRSRLYEMCESIELRGDDYRARERTPGGRRR